MSETRVTPLVLLDHMRPCAPDGCLLFRSKHLSSKLINFQHRKLRAARLKCNRRNSCRGKWIRGPPNRSPIRVTDGCNSGPHQSQEKKVARGHLCRHAAHSRRGGRVCYGVSVATPCHQPHVLAGFVVREGPGVCCPKPAGMTAPSPDGDLRLMWQLVAR